MATLQQAIDTARAEMNDTDASAYRYSVLDMLGYARDSLDAIVEVRPELFYEIDEVECIGNQAIQTFASQESLGLVRVISVIGGGQVDEVTEEFLNKNDPNWSTRTPAMATNWARIAKDPFRFFIYPPAPNGQKLIAEIIGTPKEYAAEATHNLPGSYTQIINDYIRHRMYGRDTQDQNLTQAAAFLQSFYQKLGVTIGSSSATKPSEPKKPNQ